MADFRFKYRRRASASPEEAAHEAHIADEQERRSRALALGLSIPMSLIAGTLGGYLLGHWLDAALGTGFLTITLLLLGIVGGLWMVVRQLMLLSR